jgi:hypothetical protein
MIAVISLPSFLPSAFPVTSPSIEAAGGNWGTILPNLSFLPPPVRRDDAPAAPAALATTKQP